MTQAQWTPGEGPVAVTQEVLDGIDYVLESGKTNMMDYRQVMHLASEGGFYHTVVWLNENRESYLQGFFNGFEVAE